MDKTKVCKVNTNLKGIDDFYIYGSPEDKSVMPMMDKGYYEPHIQTLFGYIVRPSMVVADVGANYGQHTILLSKLVGKNGKVIAIEASNENVDYIKQSLVKNDCRNVELINRGVWSSTTSIQFCHANTGAGWAHFSTEDWTNKESNANKIKLEVSTLDELIKDDIDFIKIDIEGSELYALQGAQKILNNEIPILIELNSHTCKKFMNVNIMEIIHYICSYGYRYIYTIIGSARWNLTSLSNLDLLFKNGAVIIDALFSKDMINLKDMR